MTNELKTNGRVTWQQKISEVLKAIGDNSASKTVAAFLRKRAAEIVLTVLGFFLLDRLDLWAKWSFLHWMLEHHLIHELANVLLSGVMGVLVAGGYRRSLGFVTAGLSTRLVAAKPFTDIHAIQERGIETEKKVDASLKQLENANELLSTLSSGFPQVVTACRLHGAVQLIEELGRQSHKREILEKLLDDHHSQLAKMRYLFSVDGYLGLLATLMGQYSELVCINRTLPVFWFSPRFPDELFVLSYRELIARKPLAVKRLTVVPRREDIKCETADALKSFDQDPDDKVKWFLILLQSLLKGSGEQKVELAARPVIDLFFRELPQDVRELIQPYVENSSKSVPELVRNMPHIVQSGIASIAKKIQELVQRKESNALSSAKTSSGPQTHESQCKISFFYSLWQNNLVNPNRVVRI